MDMMTLLDCIGPVGLIEKSADSDDKLLGARLMLSYAKATANQTYQVRIGEQILHTTALEREQASKYLLLKE